MSISISNRLLNFKNIDKEFVLEEFLNAFLRNDIDLVMYVINEDILINHEKFKKSLNFGLVTALINNHNKIVNFVLDNEKLKELIVINDNKNKLFDLAIDDEEIIKKLIFMYNIDYTAQIIDKIENYPHIKQMFDLRELNKNLSVDLIKDTDIHHTKNKI